MTSRRSSGSIRADSAVEPTKSENITVTWRRSPVSCGFNSAVTTAETTKERWFEVEIHRTAGEIALKSPKPEAGKVEAYFERAVAVARQQQAKSWELRASM